MYSLLINFGIYLCSISNTNWSFKNSRIGNMWKNYKPWIKTITIRINISNGPEVYIIACSDSSVFIFFDNIVCAEPFSRVPKYILWRSLHESYDHSASSYCELVQGATVSFSSIRESCGTCVISRKREYLVEISTAASHR